MTMHLVWPVLIVLAVTGAAAALTPYSGKLGLAKNWAIFFAEVCAFIVALLALGKALHDFMFNN